MACRQCQKNKARAKQRAEKIKAAHRDRLIKACEDGHEESCLQLHHIKEAEEFRAANKWTSEFHRRSQNG